MRSVLVSMILMLALIQNYKAVITLQTKPLMSFLNQTAKLVASDGAALDRFGVSVAISESTIVIGSYGDYRGSDYSSVYVFSLQNGDWTQTAKLVASDGAALDRFGVSVPISESTIVIGSYEDDDKGSDSGSAYVFSQQNGEWNQTAKLVASDGADDDYFGFSVAISGSTIVIGSYGDSKGSYSGSAYVFSLQNGEWTQTAKLVASDGAAYDYFGRSVAISGSTIVIGSYEDDDKGLSSGSAYVFSLQNAEWTQTAKLVASDGAAADNFGFSVAISGSTIVIGSYLDDDKGLDSGSAYIFRPYCYRGQFLDSNGSAIDITSLSNNVQVNCSSCLPGKFSNGTASCSACTAGTFANVSRLTNCFGSKMFFEVSPLQSEMTLFTGSSFAVGFDFRRPGILILRNFLEFGAMNFARFGSAYWLTSVSHGADSLVIGNFDAESIIIKVSIPRLEVIDEVNILGSLLSAVVSDGEFAYFGTFTSPSRIFKVQLSNLNITGENTLEPGDGFLSAAVVFESYLYFCTYSSPSTIIRLEKSSLLRKESLKLKESFLNSVISDGKYAYFARIGEPESATKVRLDTLQDLGNVRMNLDHR